MSDTQSTLTPWLHDGNKAPTHRAIILIFISIIVVYGNSLHCDWHYDDRFNIVDNPAIRMQRLDLKSIVKAVKEGHQQPDRIARPLAYLSFALNYLAGGLNVFGYHVINLCIHLLAATVLFFFIRSILRLPNLKSTYGPHADHVALLATIFWALHPLNVTAVTYIVQRMASMAALFYLGALYCYVKGRFAAGSWPKLTLFSASAISGLAGLATKENVAMLPIAILALEFYLIQPSGARIPLLLKSIAGAVICLFTLYSLHKLNSGGLLDGYDNRPFTLIQRLLTQPRILIFYLGLFVYPTGSRLMLLHDPVVSTGLLAPWSTLPALLLVGTGIVFAIAMRRRFPLTSFALLFFFLNHAIESSIIPLEMVYEHRNYLPTVLLSVLLAKGFINLLVYFRHSLVVYLLLVLTGAFLIGANGHSTYLYNDVLKTNLGLWMDNVRKAPELSVVHNNLGNLLMAHGETAKGLEAMGEALRHDRFNNKLQKAVVYYNIGRAYERQKGIGNGKAQEAYRRALSISPSYPKALFNLAVCKQNAGQFGEAEKLIKQAIKSSLHPKDPTLLNGLSLVKLKQGDQVEAYRHATAVLLAAPDEIAPRAVLAEIHRRRGQYRKAIQYWEAALALNANDLDGRLALTELYYQAGKMEKALCQIRHIAGLRPDSSFEMLVADQKKRANLTAWTHDHALFEAAFKHYFRAGLEAMEQGS